MIRAIAVVIFCLACMMHSLEAFIAQSSSKPRSSSNTISSKRTVSSVSAAPLSATVSSENYERAHNVHMSAYSNSHRSSSSVPRAGRTQLSVRVGRYSAPVQSDDSEQR